MVPDTGKRTVTSRWRKAVAVGLGCASTVVVSAGYVSTTAKAASFVVTTTAPSGNGSLAAAVASANGSAGADTITFAPELSGRIDTRDVPPVDDDLTIVGAGVAQLELTNTNGPGLQVTADADLTVSNLTIVETRSAGNPSDGIDARQGGSIEVTDAVIFDVRNGIVVTDDDDSHAIAFHTLSIDNVGVAGASEAAFSADRISLATIKRATIAEVGTGIAVTATNAARVEETVVSDATTGGFVFDTVRFPTVVDSAVESTGGPRPELRGIVTLNADIVNLTDVKVSDAGTEGILIDTVASSARITRVSVATSRRGMAFNDARGTDVDSATLTQNGTGLVATGATTGQVEDAEIIGNGAASIVGEGGIRLSSGTGSLTIEESIVRGNVAQTLAGGVSVVNGDNEVTIVDSLIESNSGPLAGAIHVADDDAAGAVIVDSSTISNHTAGPGIIALAAGRLELVSSTVAENASTSSLFAVNGGSMTIRHSTASRNDAQSVFSSATPATISVDHSVLAGNNGATFGSTDGVSVSNSVVSSNVPSPIAVDNIVADDPKLAQLELNGGFTPTLLPLPGSVAINGGDKAVAGAPRFDQRDFVRPDGPDDVIDIGAVEVVARPLVELVEPARLLDTRPTGTTIDGESQRIGRLADGSSTRVDVAGRAELPVFARAAVVNITAVGPATSGFITAHPCLDELPLASSLNFRAGVDSGNEVIVSLADGDDVCLFNAGETDLVMDVVGFVSFDSRYDAVGPSRLLDTRPNSVTIDGAFAGAGIRPSGSEVKLQVRGRGGVSTSATAVAMNVTAVGPVAPGFVTVHPCLPAVPSTASLNFAVGTNRGNELVAQLDTDGDVCLFVQGSTHLVVDVVGEIDHETMYVPVGPARLLETRPGTATGTIDGRENGLGTINTPQDNKVAENTIRIPFAGRAGVPGIVDAVVVNVTAIRPPSRGFFTVWDCGGQLPLAAALNFSAGDIVGNELIVEGGFSGEFCVFSSVDTHLTADIVAFLPPSESDSVLTR